MMSNSYLAISYELTIQEIHIWEIFFNHIGLEHNELNTSHFATTESINLGGYIYGLGRNQQHITWFGLHQPPVNATLRNPIPQEIYTLALETPLIIFASRELWPLLRGFHIQNVNIIQADPTDWTPVFEELKDALNIENLYRWAESFIKTSTQTISLLNSAAYLYFGIRLARASAERRPFAEPCLNHSPHSVYEIIIRLLFPNDIMKQSDLEERSNILKTLCEFCGEDDHLTERCSIIETQAARHNGITDPAKWTLPICSYELCLNPANHLLTQCPSYKGVCNLCHAPGHWAIHHQNPKNTTATLKDVYNQVHELLG